MRELQIITKRPKDMDFATYKRQLSKQNKAIKSYSKGQFIWYSKRSDNNELMLKGSLSFIEERNNGTFKGSTRELIRQTR